MVRRVPKRSPQHSTRGQTGPLLLLMITALGLCKRSVVLVRAGGEGTGEKACVIMWYFCLFFKSKKHSLGKFGEYYASFPASPGIGTYFLCCLCVTSAPDLTGPLLQGDA